MSEGVPNGVSILCSVASRTSSICYMPLPPIIPIAGVSDFIFDRLLTIDLAPVSDCDEINLVLLRVEIVNYAIIADTKPELSASCHAVMRERPQTPSHFRYLPKDERAHVAWNPRKRRV